MEDIDSSSFSPSEADLITAQEEIGRGEFTQQERVATRQFNLLTKAQRDGKWFMLKSLKPEYQEVAWCREVLRKEYDVLSHLEHPSVVRVEGLEEVPTLGLSLVMEYVSGQNLQEALREGLPHESRLRIASELIQTLAYIHRMQVVHRDLKPTNIMVVNKAGYIKLIDFGCSDGDSYTYLKQPSGTASYMSPEQKKEAIPDQRNDIYSLGCVLADLQLGKKYKSIVHRCQQPVEERYPSVEDVQKDFDRVSRHRPWGCILLPVVLLMTFLAVGIHYHWSERVYAWAKEVRLTNYDFVENGIYYNILSREALTVEVTNNGSVNAYSDDITVPAIVEHDGKRYRVVRIGNEAFYKCDSLIAVVLPQSIRSIGNSAFQQAGLLATLNLPDSITEMGDSVLRNSKRLRSVHFPKSMTVVPPYCFSGCHALRTITLDEGIRTLQRDALAECAFDSIIFPRSLRNIDRGVFWDCKHLKTLRIPATIERFGDFVFWGCDSLRNAYVERLEPLPITNIFQNLKHVQLHVPHGSAEAYRKAEGWNVLKVVEDKE